MARYRLLTDCSLDHVYHRHGDIIERPDDWKGPMRAVADFDEDGRMKFIKDGDRIRQVLKDVPLFEKLPEP